MLYINIFGFNPRLCGWYNNCIIINYQSVTNYTTSNNLKKRVVTIPSLWL